ncbi:MAG TPA: beta-ketoacyl-ACP reductase [Sphaerochaeta sp.]|nr:beta-ketoacyl-ACP reductase [Sphaerochaeta sp.]
MSKNNYIEKKFYLNQCNFGDKVVIVTGGARGIGAQIAREFAAGGAKIVLADISEKQMKDTALELKSNGVRCLTVKTDVTDWNAVQRMVDCCLEEFGRVDILVNNAGTIHPADYFTMAEKDWDFLQAVDLKGVVACSKAVAPHMIKREYGKIVNISSMAAFGVYMPGFSSYSAAKAAVNDFTKTSARELGKFGINVNAVAPGEIMTDLTFQDQSKEDVAKKLERSKAMAMVGRIGMPEDVANLVCFLASDCASFITGEVINVDGGRIDRM